MKSKAKKHGRRPLVEKGASPKAKLPRHWFLGRSWKPLRSTTKKTLWELIGMSKKDFTASQLTKKGGKKGDTVTGRVGGSTCLLSVVQNFVNFAPDKPINLYDRS